MYYDIIYYYYGRNSRHRLYIITVKPNLTGSNGRGSIVCYHAVCLSNSFQTLRLYFVIGPRRANNFTLFLFIYYIIIIIRTLLSFGFVPFLILFIHTTITLHRCAVNIIWYFNYSCWVRRATYIIRIRAQYHYCLFSVSNTAYLIYQDKFELPLFS